MLSVFLRILVTALAALTGIGLFLYSNHSLQNHFNENLSIRNNLQSLQTDLYALKSEILQNGSFLYHSYDNIHRLTHATEETLQALESSPALQSEIYRKSWNEIHRLSRVFATYTEEIEQYLTLNAALKNSIIYIPTLQLRAYSLFDVGVPEDRNTLLLLSKINASIFLANNAQDLDFLQDIRTYMQQIDQLIRHYTGAQKRLLLTLKKHLNLFIDDFPAYTHHLDQLIHNDLIERSILLDRTFQKESTQELKQINNTSRQILFLYLLSLGMLSYFILKTYWENRRLKKLKSELEYTLVTDNLTGLGNRLAYQRMKRKIKNPVLILVNIDRFKHINEFYGTRLGDLVLVKVSQELKRITPQELKATLFRMGGDDFGILFDKERYPMQLITLLKNYQESLENYHIEVEDLVIDLSFALGASDRKSWLFETADMALKMAKSSQRLRYALYDITMDKREEIAQNIHALHSIHHAIEHDNLLPYFQPIYDLRNHRIDKFEALARIELDGGKHILHPYSFIHAATEAKLSGKITLRILEQTLKVAEKNPYDFSVNIAAGDIDEVEGSHQIIELLERYRHLTDRIIFEILENEEIRDYDRTAEFIRIVKHYGCRIALDDFGSGYSNFEKILKLDIDILKVDGSLIKKIDHDRYSELTVQSILDFAQHAGWKTVAEFVHSPAVYNKTATMGFDYLQGYYIGKPSKNLPIDNDRKIIR